MPDADGSWRAAAGCLALFGFALLGGVAAYAAVDHCLVAWGQHLGEVASGSLEVLATVLGLALALSLGIALLRLFSSFAALRTPSPEGPTKTRIVVLSLLSALLAMAFAVVLFIGFTGLDWREFSPPDSGFRILLPGTPVEMEEGEDTPQGRARGKRFLTHNRRTNKRFQAYIAAYVDYPEGFIERNSAEKVFQLQKEALVPSEGQLVSEKPMTLRDVAGTELQVESHDGRILVLRMYLVQQRLFLLVAMTGG
jgi:hypothetical protein